MTPTQTAARDSFVLLHAAGRRFALPAHIVVELAPPVRLHTFPHTSSNVVGVIVRRGRIVPVYDAGPEFLRISLSHRFYLIADCKIGAHNELGAIPVDGECEMATGEVQSVAPNRPKYICGSLMIGMESVDVLDFNALVAPASARPSIANAASQVHAEAHS
jgi:chemotaxis signal transduction protein